MKKMVRYVDFRVPKHYHSKNITIMLIKHRVNFSFFITIYYQNHSKNGTYTFSFFLKIKKSKKIEKKKFFFRSDDLLFLTYFYKG